MFSSYWDIQVLYTVELLNKGHPFCGQYWGVATPKGFYIVKNNKLCICHLALFSSWPLFRGVTIEGFTVFTTRDCVILSIHKLHNFNRELSLFSSYWNIQVLYFYNTRLCYTFYKYAFNSIFDDLGYLKWIYFNPLYCSISFGPFWSASIKGFLNLFWNPTDCLSLVHGFRE